VASLEGKTLSSTDTLENNPQPETAEATQVHDHEHEGHDHEHDHQHGPVLNPECTRELVLDIAAEEVTKAYAKVVKNYRKYAKIPGFRAGKVPETVVKRRYETEIRKEVIDGLLPERFNKAVVELGVRPEIEQLRESRATIEPVEEDRALVDGDWAEITYKGQIEGETEAAPVAGENTLVEIGGKDTVEAFTTALRGAKPGQELKAEVIYPADYAEPKLAGKTVAYEVEVKAIKKRTLPEMDDDFAKELGAYESYADLEARVREHLGLRKRRSVEGETKDRLLAALNERYPFPIPESLVQEQIDVRLDRGLRALAAQGMDTEQMRKLDFGRLRAAQRDGATAEAKANILLDRIATEEKIVIADEELDRELQLAALQSREPLDTLKVRLTEDGGLARIREQMRREKTASVLYERLPA
jgi:trigger factor